MVFPRTLFLLEGMDDSVRVQVQTTRARGLAKAHFPYAVHAFGACKTRQGAMVFELNMAIRRAKAVTLSWRQPSPTASAPLALAHATPDR